MSGEIVGRGTPSTLVFYRVIDLKCTVCGFTRRTFRDLQTGVTLYGLTTCPTCGETMQEVKYKEFRPV